MILDYEAASAIIERIAKNKARFHKKIGYLDADDIAQEVRIKCWAALEKYDPAKNQSDVEPFLWVCAENRIRDLRRSIVYNHNKPCFRCPFWNEVAAQSGMHDCFVYSYKYDCDKYSKHERFVQLKLALSHPSDIEHLDPNNLGLYEEIDIMSIHDFIKKSLPSGMLPHFSVYCSGNYSMDVLPKSVSRTLSKHLQNIYIQYRSRS